MSEGLPNGVNTNEPQQPVGPSLVMNAQYLKDLSFENPRAPETLLTQQPGAPDIAVDVDVKARQIGDDVFEVMLGIKVQATMAGQPFFVVEIDYGATVTVRNAPPELLGLLILVETPRMIFPFARNIIADATRDGGYPPLLLSPIDFAELHRRKLIENEALAKAASTAQA